MKTLFRSGALALALLAAGALPAAAQARSPDQIAAAVPTDVPEVHTGGGWVDGKAQGVYRAIVVLTAGDNTARVFLQWIAMKPDSPTPEIVATVPIKEVAEKKLPNAFLTLEAEREGEVVVVVSSFDPATAKDTTLAFKASKPGTYAPTNLPGPGSGSAVPQGKQ